MKKFNVKWLFLLTFVLSYLRTSFKPEPLNLGLVLFTIVAYFWCNWQEKRSDRSILFQELEQFKNEAKDQIRIIKESQFDCQSKFQDLQAKLSLGKLNVR